MEGSYSLSEGATAYFPKSQGQDACAPILSLSVILSNPSSCALPGCTHVCRGMDWNGMDDGNSIEAHVQSLPFVFDFSLFCLTFTFSLRGIHWSLA